jgi:hypothetical protein
MEKSQWWVLRACIILTKVHNMDIAAMLIIKILFLIIFSSFILDVYICFLFFQKPMNSETCTYVGTEMGHIKWGSGLTEIIT